MSKFKVGDKVLRAGVEKSQWRYEVVSKKGFWVFTKYLITPLKPKDPDYYIEASWHELYLDPLQSK